jgi:hypothetical protein
MVARFVRITILGFADLRRGGKGQQKTADQSRSKTIQERL